MRDVKSLKEYIKSMANIEETDENVQLALLQDNDYMIHKGVLWFSTLETYRQWADTDDYLGVCFRDLWPKDAMVQKAWFKWIPESLDSYIEAVKVIRKEGSPDYRINTSAGIGLAWFKPTTVDTIPIVADDKTNIYNVIKQLISSFGEGSTT
jgi:hypothetical protein